MHYPRLPFEHRTTMYFLVAVILLMLPTYSERIVPRTTLADDEDFFGCLMSIKYIIRICPTSLVFDLSVSHDAIMCSRQSITPVMK